MSSDPRACALPDSPLAAEIKGLDACVHCGFCLQACPTYAVLEDENDSPRGRILLMRELLDGHVAPDDPGVQLHIDRCLGCRACEPACPSGVPYGVLLEATRATLREARPAPCIARAILHVVAQPTLCRIACAFTRALRWTRLPRALSQLPGRLGFAFGMLAASESGVPSRSYLPRGDGSRGPVAVFLGCVMEGLFGPTNRATERVLAENDYALRAAPAQQCCGALHAHSGDLDEARRLARRNIAAFDSVDGAQVVVNAAGCGAMLKGYGHLLAADPEWSARAAAFSARVRDISEALAAAGPKTGGPLAGAACYDAPCHLAHGQGVVRQPLDVLRVIPGFATALLPGAEQCCGGAGIYALLEPETSDAVLATKLAEIRASGAQWVATGNPGCIMQIGAGLAREGISARAVHPIDLLDASYSTVIPAKAGTQSSTQDSGFPHSRE